MIEKITQIFKIKELRDKILFVLGILVVFRLAANIPVPGVNVDQLKNFFENNQFFGLLNMFSGGGLRNISIVMLGVGPYITASIIMQLLTMIIPRLEQIYKEEGEAGRQKFNMWTRWITVPLAALQTFGMISLFRSQGIFGDLTSLQLGTIILTATAGTVFLMWLGELITEKNIGNGVSIIIFAGIVASLPTSVSQTLVIWDPAKVFTYLGYAVFAVLVIAAIVFITEGQRNIPVSYAKRVRGNRVYGGTSTHLPIRVNQAGVIPIIFAMSIMLFPGMIANFFVHASNPTVANIAVSIDNIFKNQWFYGASYFILVVLFTYFYTAVTFDPKNIAENLQKQGGFVPGIRPGQATSEYLHKVLNRITLTGALFLGAVAVLPFVVQGVTNLKTLTIGGTGILIVVSVVIEIMKQIESQMIMRDYEGF
jgi:preprotein translocase subunit SecY